MRAGPQGEEQWGRREGQPPHGGALGPWEWHLTPPRSRWPQQMARCESLLRAIQHWELEEAPRWGRWACGGRTTNAASFTSEDAGRLDVHACAPAAPGTCPQQQLMCRGSSGHCTPLHPGLACFWVPPLPSCGATCGPPVGAPATLLFPGPLLLQEGLASRPRPGHRGLDFTRDLRTSGGAAVPAAPRRQAGASFCKGRPSLP